MQAPNHGNWQGQNDKVHDNVEDLVDNNELLSVETLGINALVPVASQRPTLQRTRNEDRSSPAANEAVESQAHMLKYGNGEDSTVKADDGDFDRGAHDKVRELICQEDLCGDGVSRLSSRETGQWYLP